VLTACARACSPGRLGRRRADPRSSGEFTAVSIRARRLSALLGAGRAGHRSGKDDNGRARRSGRRRGDDRCRASRRGDLGPVPGPGQAGQGTGPGRRSGGRFRAGPGHRAGVSPQWEDIGLGAITDIVQHAFGPVDLDGSPVELRMADSRPGCPACAGKRFHFPAELAEARDRMCPAYRAEAEAVITHRLGRAAASNPDGWRALGGASRRLEQPHLPNGLATKLAGAVTAMHVIRSRQSTQLGLHIEHATAVSRPGRGEAGEPVPQGEVRRGGVLYLQGEHAAHRVDDVEWLAPEQHLPAERGPVQRPRGDPNTGTLLLSCHAESVARTMARASSSGRVNCGPWAGRRT